MTQTRAPARVAILDAGGDFAAKLSDFISTEVPELEVVLVATLWAQLVASDNFPTRIVFLDADGSEAVSLAARIRACRATGAVVVVTTASPTGSVRWNQVHEIGEMAGAISLFSTMLELSSLTDFRRRLDSLLSLANPQEDWRPPPGKNERSTPVASNSLAPKLSRGEAEALGLYASGKTMVEVAREMNVQFETVKTFLRRVREKYAQLGRPASNRAVLTSNALEDGFLT
jgi:DNA-binding CsgD family transcriptional regulator